MSIIIPARGEKDLFRIVQTVRQLCEGRSNATGTVTLAASAATTTVANGNCGVGSIIMLTPQTANAAAALATTYILASNVTAEQFIISHANNAQTDKIFGYEIRG